VSAITRTRELEETERGLRGRPKELPAVWLYDARGFRLYEEVTRLPEYYLPGRERELLLEHAPAIAARLPARTLVELGAGPAKNVRLLLDAFPSLERFVPLDVNEAAVQANATDVAAAYPRLLVEPVAGDFELDLDSLPDAEVRIVAFLGSTIGNLSPVRRSRLLTRIAAALAPRDAFLVGLDLVKDPAQIEAAYNDPHGVTEAFVRNALTAANRELGADFDQASFEYEASWDAEHEWMDIGFRARRCHMVRVQALELELPFEPGEPLRVEISAKFRREQVEREAADAGLRVDEWWSDQAQDYALALLSHA
jgi:L-histidine N-alpha-methyltransferase